MTTNVNWNGDQVKAALLRASRFGIDETTTECVKDAKVNVPRWTTALQGSIRIQPAEVDGNVVSGLWGSWDINYALAVETGNRGLIGPNDLGGELDPNRGDLLRRVNSGNKNFLRNAADLEYPQLSGRIKARSGTS